MAFRLRAALHRLLLECARVPDRSSVADLSVHEAIAISIGLLIVAWLVYDALCRALGRWPKLLALALLGFIGLSAYVAGRLFAPRAMFIEVGSMIGTMMVGNVFFVIIPAHWELIRAKRAGREPDPAPGIKAKLRSVHNNYLTLPVPARDAQQPLPLRVRTRRRVARAVRIRRARCVHPALLQPQARRSHAVVDAGRRGGSRACARALARAAGHLDGAGRHRGIAAGKQIFLTAGCSGCHTLEDAGASGHVGPNLDAARPSRALVINRVTNGQA